MATIRELIDAGFDLDTELVARRDEESDVAYGTVFERRYAALPGNTELVVLELTDEFVVIADEANEDDETESDYQSRLMSDPGFMEFN